MSSAENVSPFKVDTLALATQTRKRVKINKDGTADVPAELYEELLNIADPSIDVATAKKVQAAHSNIVAGFTLGVGENGLDAMKKHPKIEQVTAELKAGRDEIEVVLNRSREINDMKNPGGDKLTQYGATTVKYTVRGTANSGELKKVRQHILSQGAEILNS
jgi:hypothetical protein